MDKILTVGEAARWFGVAAWKIRRVIARGLYPEPKRLGGWFRVFGIEEMPELRKALVKAGYLKPKPGECSDCQPK